MIGILQTLDQIVDTTERLRAIDSVVAAMKTHPQLKHQLQLDDVLPRYATHPAARPHRSPDWPNCTLRLLITIASLSQYHERPSRQRDQTAPSWDLPAPTPLGRRPAGRQHPIRSLLRPLHRQVSTRGSSHSYLYWCLPKSLGADRSLEITSLSSRRSRPSGWSGCS